MYSGKNKEFMVAFDNFGGSTNEPWFVTGDFNTVMIEEERFGCQCSKGSARDFNKFILGLGLMDAG